MNTTQQIKTTRSNKMNLKEVRALDYKKAQQKSKELNKKVNDLSRLLNTKYPEKGEMGLTPDSIKFSSEFQEDKFNFRRAFEELRTFNKSYIKLFKKELKAERRNKYNLMIQGA